MTRPAPPPDHPLAALEEAFAADPESGAWRPLAEAYLGAGRFMEATVVCRRGLRSRPEDPAARELLARVLTAQGKDPRGAGAHPPAPIGAPLHEAVEAPPQAPSDRYSTQTFELRLPRPARAGPARGEVLRPVGLALAVTAVVAAAGWGLLHARDRAARAEAEAGVLREAEALLARDGFEGLRAAAEKGRALLALDGDSLAGHALLAYVGALRAVEHGDGEAVRAEAAGHLAAGRRLGPHARLLAAEAVLRGAGDPAGAARVLGALLEDPSRRSALLAGTLGELLLEAGELDRAAEWLGLAQTIAPEAPRHVQRFAELRRRRGGPFAGRAEAGFKHALELEADHLPSLLGLARLLLDEGRLEEAWQVAERAASARGSPRQQALVAALRSAILGGRGRTAEAGVEARRAAELDPQGPGVTWLSARR